MREEIDGVAVELVTSLHPAARAVIAIVNIQIGFLSVICTGDRVDLSVESVDIGYLGDGSCQDYDEQDYERLFRCVGDGFVHCQPFECVYELRLLELAVGLAHTCRALFV